MFVLKKKIACEGQSGYKPGKKGQEIEKKIAKQIKENK